MTSVFVFDPTINDKKSAVRGVGRYLKILKENFPQWSYLENLNKKNLSFDSTLINPFFNLFKAPLTFKKIAKKQILVIHDLIPLKYEKNFPVGLKGKINFFLNKLVLKNYDLIVTDSNASKADIVNLLKIPKSKIKVVYPCLSLNFFKEKNIKDSKKFRLLPKLPENYCLYVGDATWNKNLVNLAKAIKISNVSCVFVGKIFEKKEKLKLNHPWQKELKDFLRMAKDDKRFIFLGYVEDDLLISLYQRARLNVLVSQDEGFGFSYLEASKMACPSVLSDIPVFQEIGKNACLFAKKDDPYDIAYKIGEIYFNQKLKEELGKRALKRSLFFSRENFKKQWQEIL